MRCDAPRRRQDQRRGEKQSAKGFASLLCSDHIIYIHQLGHRSKNADAGPSPRVRLSLRSAASGPLVLLLTALLIGVMTTSAASAPS